MADLINIENGDTGSVSRNKINTSFAKVDELADSEAINTAFVEKSKVYTSPFQENATFGAHPELKEFAKYVKLYNCDVSKHYAISSIRRNSSGQWLLNVADVDTSGTVCQLLTSTSPESDPITVLSEVNSSGISGHCVLDWSVITVSQITNIGTYEIGGFSPDVYVSNINPDVITALEPDVKILKIPKIYAVVGQEVSIYFDNIILAVDRDNYDIQVSAAANTGNMNSYRWYFTPTSASDTAIRIKVSGKTDGTLIEDHVIQVIVTEASNDSAPVETIMDLGDSITNYMTHIEVCVDKFKHSDDSPGVNFIGTIGTAPIQSDGYAGWRADMFLDTANFNGFDNAFLNPTTEVFDFAYYMSSTGFDTPDRLFIALGTNDCYGNTPAVFLSNIQQMITSIHAFDSNIKIVISLVIPPGKAGDITKNGFEMSNTNWGLYNRFYATFQYNELLIETFGGGTGNIDIIPADMNLDRFHNFEIIDVPVSDRLASAYTVSGDSTHPLIEGRRQLGDSYYYYLKGTQ